MNKQQNCMLNSNYNTNVNGHLNPTFTNEQPQTM
jgi:hypothetical protein